MAGGQADGGNDAGGVMVAESEDDGGDIWAEGKCVHISQSSADQSGQGGRAHQSGHAERAGQQAASGRRKRRRAHASMSAAFSRAELYANHSGGLAQMGRFRSWTTHLLGIGSSMLSSLIVSAVLCRAHVHATSVASLGNGQARRPSRLQARSSVSQAQVSQSSAGQSGQGGRAHQSGHAEHAGHRRWW